MSGGNANAMPERDPVTVLLDDPDTMPRWLADYEPGSPLPLEEFLLSRVVYYPACGPVWHDLGVFGTAHAAHCFVRADHVLTPDHIMMQMTGEGREEPFDKYRLLTSRVVQSGTWATAAPARDPAAQATRDFHTLITMLEQLCVPCHKPVLSHPRLNYPQARQNHHHCEPNGGPFVLLAIFEREANADNRGGPARVAILHLGLDALVGFDALFCQMGATFPYVFQGRRFPYAVVLDGTCYDGWAFGGIYGVRECELLGAISLSGLRKRPEWLLVKRGITAWPQYARMSGPDGEGDEERVLYRR
jgi:hypothetical protein